MKIKFILFLNFMVVSIAILISCNKGATKKKLNGIYIVPQSGSSIIESKTVLSFVTTPYKYPLGAGILSPVSVNVNLTIGVENSLVAAYNSAQNTNYAVLPAGSYSLEATSLTIQKDSVVSQKTNLVINANMLDLDVTYLVPVKITSIAPAGTGITLNDAVATKYYTFRAPTPVIGNLSDNKRSYWKDPNTSNNPERGNDGNTDGNWIDLSVCESGAGTEQYWEVDLGNISPRIDTIRIWNRTDCCDERTINFHVFISDAPFSGTTVAASLAQPGVSDFYIPGKAGRPTEILPKVSGRYIRLQNTGGTSLTLAELTAIGIKP